MRDLLTRRFYRNLMLRLNFRKDGSNNSNGPLQRVKHGIALLIGAAMVLVALYLLYPFASAFLDTGSLEGTDMELLFIGLIMLVIGIVFLLGTRSNMREQRRYDKAFAHEEPWKLRESWRENLMTHRTRPIRALIVLGVIFTVMGLFGTVSILDEAIFSSEDPEYAALLILIFPTAGLIMLGVAYRLWQRGKRFGVSELRLDEVPARLGATVRGRVLAQLPADDLPRHGIRVECSCYRRSVRYERSGGKNNSRTKRVDMNLLWRDEHHMRPKSVTSEGVEIPFTFDLPEDYPTSTPIRRSDSYLARTRENDIRWKVEVHAELPGPNYDAAFEIPVFAPADADAPERTVEEASDEATEGKPVIPASALTGSMMAGASPEDPYAEYVIQPNLDAPISKNISLEQLPDEGLRLHVASQRDSWTPYVIGAIGALLVLIALPGLILGMGFFGSLIFAGFGGLMLYGAKTMLTHETILTIENGTATVQTGAGGKKKTSIPVRDLKDAEVEITGTQGQSHYRIILHRYEDTVDQPEGVAGQLLNDVGSFLGEERANSLASGIQQFRTMAAQIDNLHDKREADWIAKQINKTLDRQLA